MSLKSIDKYKYIKFIAIIWYIPSYSLVIFPQEIDDWWHNGGPSRPSGIDRRCEAIDAGECAVPKRGVSSDFPERSSEDWVVGSLTGPTSYHLVMTNIAMV